MNRIWLLHFTFCLLYTFVLYIYTIFNLSVRYIYLYILFSFRALMLYFLFHVLLWAQKPVTIATT